MKVKHLLFFITLSITFMLALLLNGCASPPESERSAAKTAMDSAQSVFADKYAAADFSAAKQLWITAETQIREKKYQEAKQSYLDAKAAFEKAEGGVAAGKKAWIGQANAAIAELEEGWKSLEAAAKQVEGKMDKRELWETDANSFREGLNNAKAMVNIDPAGVVAKANQLKQFFTTYGMLFKQMAAGPIKNQHLRKRNRAEEE